MKEVALVMYNKEKICGHCMTNQPNMGIYCQVTNMVANISGTSTPLCLVKALLNNDGDGGII